MPESWAAKNVSLIEAGLIAGEWFEYARDAQYPLGPTLDNWPDTWLVMGGRGAGKTRLGAEWINSLVRGFSPFANRDGFRIPAVLPSFW